MKAMIANLGIAIATLVVSIPSHAQDWERLPDGRVVIEIKGTRLAFEPDIDKNAAHASVRFLPRRGPLSSSLSFRDVIEQPDRARSKFAAWDDVTIRTWNSRTGQRQRYLGRYDNTRVPDSPRIELTIWGRPIGKLCRPEEAVPGTSDDCPRFNALARNPPELDEDGLIVVQPPPRASPSYVTYIFPAAEQVSATNEAIYFQCEKVLRGCRNNVIQYYGYAIRENVSLYYEFMSHHYPKNRLRNLHQAMREIFDDVLISP